MERPRINNERSAERLRRTRYGPMLSIRSATTVGYLTKAVAQAREGLLHGRGGSRRAAGAVVRHRGRGARAVRRGRCRSDGGGLHEPPRPRAILPRTRARRGERPHRSRPAAGTYGQPSRSTRTCWRPTPGTSPERHAELRGQAERSTRQAVSFIDLTFSVSKSVTVLGVAFERAANDAATGDHESAAA